MARGRKKKSKQERLWKASKEGDVAAVRALLKTRSVNVNAGDFSWGQHGWTPLHYASLEGHLQVAELLFLAGANLNATTEDGFSPLHLASAQGHLGVMEWLLNAGADRNATAQEGWTPLHGASSTGYLPVVERLLKADADPNFTPANIRETPLHIACGFHRSEIARALLASGADLHAKDIEGHDPLNVCLSHNRRFLSDEMLETLDTLQVLVSFGATWDANCDELVSSGKARNEALALRICMILWTQERADGLPFTSIPLEVIERGTDSTQAYIDDRKTSSAIILRRKICLVGSSCAGKTSLIKSIISEQPQLEHVDNRTIGIDHFPLRFSESNIGSDGKRKIHEVTFWDFAGQDVYQVAHSLFFSRRTLYLVCVDIAAFTVAYKQAVIFANHDFQETKLLDEFVEDSAMRWVRMIVARQPDAEFVFIATKADAHGDNKVTEELLKESLMDKLKQVNTAAQQMKEPKEKNTRVEHGSSVGLVGLWKKGATAVQWMADQYKTVNQDRKGCVGVASTDPTVVFVSCTSRALTREARIKIRDLVIKSGYSFEMPDTYTRVLKEIVRIRDEAKATLIGTRISRVFARAESLPTKLGVESDMCRTILQTLHDLGDVLWYEDLGVALLGNTVILEPLFLIDFIRQVFNHNNACQILPHANLKAMDYWIALDSGNDGSKKQMEAMKQVLQAFHLVYSADEYRVMKWNSDLIVPAFWQTKTPAAWLFLGDILRINTTRSHEGEAVRVHWEYHFESGLPPPFFDHLVVASVSPNFTFAAGPDWIMHKEEGSAACRIMVGRDPRSLHRTIEVEAVVAEKASEDQVEKLWMTFEQMCAAFVKVLRKNPGLKVSSFAWTDEAGKKNMDDLLWSNSKRPPGKWMPPAETWGRFKRLATGQDRTRTIEEDWEGM